MKCPCFILRKTYLLSLSWVSVDIIRVPSMTFCPILIGSRGTISHFSKSFDSEDTLNLLSFYNTCPSLTTLTINKTRAKVWLSRQIPVHMDESWHSSGLKMDWGVDIGLLWNDSPWCVFTSCWAAEIPLVWLAYNCEPQRPNTQGSPPVPAVTRNTFTLSSSSPGTVTLLFTWCTFQHDERPDKTHT